jgi:hypothetical protein
MLSLLLRWGPTIIANASIGEFAFLFRIDHFFHRWKSLIGLLAPYTFGRSFVLFQRTSQLIDQDHQFFRIKFFARLFGKVLPIRVYRHNRKPLCFHVRQITWASRQLSEQSSTLLYSTTAGDCALVQT